MTTRSGWPRKKTAKVSLHCEPGQVRLQISDEGTGFETGTVRAHQMGLEIMRERAQAVGAILNIESRPGHGTRIAAEWRDA